MFTAFGDVGMKRRTVLASVASGTATIAGCALMDSESTDETPDGPSNSSTDGTSGDDPRTAGESPDVPTQTGECGPAGQRLSELLTDDAGPACDDPYRTTDLRIENERGTALTAGVRIEHEESTVFEADADLEPGEYVDEEPEISPEQFDTVTVTLPDGSEFTDSWSGDSCRLHGVAIGEDGIEAGYVEPVDGVVDGAGTCYPERENRFRVSNSTEDSQTVTATIVDHCAETTTESTMELRGGGAEIVTKTLLTGGRYTVAVDVENGPGATGEYGADCGPFRVIILEDEIRFTISMY